MGNLGDFKAAVREVDPDREPEYFILEGERFELAEGVSALPLMELAGSAGPDKSNAEAAVTVLRFLEAILKDGDEWQRFRATCQKHRVSADVLSDITSAITEALSGRPTSRLSDSPSGAPPISHISREASSVRSEFVTVGDALEAV